MPAHRLGKQAALVRRFDVVAQDSDGDAHFVSHVGLSNQERSIALNDVLDVLHMGPPLQRQKDGISVHALGTAELTVGETRQINVFADEHLSEYAAEKVRDRHQYTIMPHCREADASCSVRRFNCAGFVIEAYRYAGIDLVITDMDLLPVVPLETLAQAYPEHANYLENRNFRKKFGLEGDGPWPVILVGYVMNALKRPAEEIRKEPYRPRLGDEYFVS